MKIIFALLLAVVGGALFAQPYYTAYQMRAAADRRDHEALASYIDFPAVRASLKRQGPEFAQRQVAKKVGEGPLSELGGLLGSEVRCLELLLDALLLQGELLACEFRSRRLGQIARGH